jgi:FixJ family two-component response regulator
VLFRSPLVLALVDDDQDVRRSVARLLRARGYVVHLFDSAEAYLARDCHADCAILDVHLSGISGLELEGRLRETGRGVPVVFITGRDDAAVRAAVRASRMPCLTKPFDEAGLLAAIAQATGGDHDGGASERGTPAARVM